MDTERSAMSFREKTAWIAVLSITAIYGVYFWSAVRFGAHASADLFTLTVTVVGLVVVQIVLMTAAAIFSPKDAQAPRDERDRLIALRATRVAYSGLATSVVFAAFFGAFN